jgi:glycosyltransferase involved in cell wall biosynthesis
MKVLQLISSGGYYGAEAVVVNLSKSLNELGNSSTVGTFDNTHNSNLEVAEVAGREGLRVELICCRGRVDWHTVRSIRTFARQEQIEAIHAHGYKAQIYGFLAAGSLSTQLVATCHGYHSRFSEKGRTVANLRQEIYGALDRALLRRFDQIVATSNILADSLRSSGIANDRITVIHNGVDLREFGSVVPSADLDRLKCGRLAIGLVGRLIDGKGHRELFAAAKDILVRHPATLLFVIGEGPLRRSLEESARELGIERSVIFTGKRTDMPNVYAALDVVALPSLFEGMPMVILEALAARKAVIATRVGAVPDVILDGSTGLLIEPGDIPQLGRTVSRLIADAGLRRSLAEKGHAFLNAHFSAASMAAKYLSVYERRKRR